MDFYQSISNYYQHIFPLNKAQLTYINSAREDDKKQLSILDIGCAIGDLSLELSDYFKEVIGIDLDEGMINKANEKGKNKGNLHFCLENMLHIDQSFGVNRFDLIACFGNTLVHLGSEEVVLDFFRSACSSLKDDGKLLFQIINYDRIIDQKINFLPTIENESIKFERNYMLHLDSKKVDFETLLTIKESGLCIKNSIPLLALRKATVRDLLQEAGFTDIKFYSNFKRDASTANSMPLVVEAKV